MGFKEIFSGFFNDKKTGTLKEICIDLGVEYHYKKLAIETCVNLIASALVRAKFKTFKEGKEKKNHVYYLFNVQPNQNQNGTEFFHELVSNLVLDNECLVIKQGPHLYIADSFTVERFAFKENIYKDIVVNGFEMNKTFLEQDVFYFKLNNEPIRKAVDSMYESYGKLLTSSLNYYKRSNALRVKYKMEGNFSQQDEDQQAMEELFNAQLGRFLKAEDAAALPEQDGLTIDEMFVNTKGASSRDVREVVDDIFDFVSMAFHIPKGLLKGDLADLEGQTDSFLMFCISPIAELIEDEVNRKFYTKAEFLNRTYFKIDTTFIKHVDPIKLATALDKLFASGTHNTNDNREVVGKEPIDEEWANEHHITKNYESVKELLKGGDG